MNIVLSGSGLLYPVHAGAMGAVIDRGIKIDSLTGVSGGAIIAAAIACGYDSREKLTNLVLESLPYENDLIDFTLFPFYHWGLIKGDALEQELKKKFGNKKFKDLALDLNIIAVHIDTKMEVVFNRENTPEVFVHEAVRASISIPLVFKPYSFKNSQVERQGLYVDGGVAVGFPLDIYGEGNDVIGFRFASDYRNPTKRMNFRKYIFSVIETMLESSNREHMDDAQFARVCVFRPKGGSLNLWMDRDDASKLMGYGYDKANQWLKTNI